MRKPIQIAISAAASDGRYEEEIIALCNDGSVWSVHGKFGDPPREYWRRLPDIPQEEDDASE